MNHFLEPLTTDHRETETLLSRLERMLQQPSSLNEAGSLFQQLQQALLQHYACEEHALFPVLSQYRPMILMAVEHDDLLKTEAAFAKALATACKQQTIHPDLHTAFDAFNTQLRHHITEEDNGIFPLADKVLEPEEKALVQRKLTEFLSRLQQSPETAQQILQRPTPTYSIQSLPLSDPPTRPITYQTLSEIENTHLQHIALTKGQSLQPHWAGQHQQLLVLSGQLHLDSQGEPHTLHPGHLLHLEPQRWFSLQALSDSHCLLFKTWPRPYFLRQKP